MNISHWELPQFSDMVERLGEAKLSYVASATLLESIGMQYLRNFSRWWRRRTIPYCAESLRDFAANKRFRRNLFAREALLSLSVSIGAGYRSSDFALVLPRDKVVFKVRRTPMELAGRDDIQPVADLLAKKIANFDELLALPPFGEDKAGSLLDCLAFTPAK